MADETRKYRIVAHTPVGVFVSSPDQLKNADEFFGVKEKIGSVKIPVDGGIAYIQSDCANASVFVLEEVTDD